MCVCVYIYMCVCVYMCFYIPHAYMIIFEENFFVIDDFLKFIYF